MTRQLGRQVDRHYGGLDLRARILDRLRAAGKNVGRLTRDDLASFDELHTGGRPSTRALAELAAFAPGTRVLDVGSGIGGPARTLAAEFGCRPVGIDLTGEFCRAAAMLNGLVGFSGRVAFVQGNALALPFGDGAFEAVWSQNAIMNIEDKPRLFHEIHRVLRSGGTVAFEAALAGPGGPAHYPTFWAPSPDLSFLTRPSDMHALVAAAGFVEVTWEDTTAQVLERARARRAGSGSEASALGRDVVIADDLEAKVDNAVRNSEEGRVVTMRAVLRAP